MWIALRASPEAMDRTGFVELNSDSDGDVTRCPHCEMLISGVPGGLVSKHLAQCGGSEEQWQKMEERMITDLRVKWLEEKIIAEMIRIKAEREEAERKERFGRIREEMLVRQQAKDKKKRMREQTRKELRNR